MKILTLNSGSSSLKYTLFESSANHVRALFHGHLDNHGKPIKNFGAAVDGVMRAIKKSGLIGSAAEIAAVGHRVVHGGERFTEPTRITPSVCAVIDTLSARAPLHNPANLACILSAQKLMPHALHVAVFDTAFHQTMPEKAYLYGIPYALYKKFHIRRYGFHGISHQYVFEVARKKLGRSATMKTVTCHLGNGCSITAIKNGTVIDTSMGFTPLAGVPMGTRSGDIDPSIVFYLLERGYSAEKIQTMLNLESGLKGVSQISSDVRDLWAGYQKKDSRALRTLEWFAYTIAKYIGAYRAALGGLDCIVFTGGIGENAHYLRRWVRAYFKDAPRLRVLVIPTNEEQKIAEETWKIAHATHSSTP